MVLLRSIFVLVVLQRSTSGLITIDLAFSSNNCDEESRTITANKVYNLTWDGQIVPELCRFQFTAGKLRNKSYYEVCFESAVYNLPNSFFVGVELNIKNNTRRAWNFDYNDISVPRTCVARAYKMSVSIQVPSGYVEPQPATYILMQITADIVTDPEPDQLITVICVSVFGGTFLSAFFLGIFCNRFKNSNTCVGQCVRGTLICFGNIRSRCILKCAWLQRLRGGNSLSQVTTRPRITLVSTSVICSGNDLPPSYSSVIGLKKEIDSYIEPAFQPPSYEDVMSQMVPSPPTSNNKNR